MKQEKLSEVLTQKSILKAWVIHCKGAAFKIDS
jgi:hypothetical protein